jgi:hypothetical protein
MVRVKNPWKDFPHFSHNRLKEQAGDLGSPPGLCRTQTTGLDAKGITLELLRLKFYYS